MFAGALVSGLQEGSPQGAELDLEAGCTGEGDEGADTHGWFSGALGGELDGAVAFSGGRGLRALGELAVEGGELRGDAVVFEGMAFVGGQLGFGVVPVGFALADGAHGAVGLPTGVVRAVMAFLEAAPLEGAVIAVAVGGQLVEGWAAGLVEAVAGQSGSKWMTLYRALV